MKRFRFTLETVLKVKRQKEEVRKRELAAAQMLKDLALVRLGALETALKAAVEDQAGRRGKRIDLAGEQWFQQRRSGLQAAIARATKELLEKEKALDEARARAVEAARETKVLEKLEEKQYQEHVFRLNREEQGFLDELAQHTESKLSWSSPAAYGQ